MTIHDLMDLILQEVPAVEEKRREVLALIKTFIHEEKHKGWDDFRNQFRATLCMDAKVYVDAEVETHWLKAQYKENLQWARRYGKKRKTKGEQDGKTI